MSPQVQVVLSGALTFGIPLAFALRELAVLRRRRPAPRRPDDPGSRPSPTRPRDDSPGQRPLPACLIPLRMPAPARSSRELERV